MNPLRISIAVLAAAAVVQGPAARAAPTYQGSAIVQDYSVIPIVTNRADGLTGSPTAYSAAVGASHAESVSQAIDNGTAESTATAALNGVVTAYTEIRYLMTLVALPGATTLPNGTIPVRFIASGEADAHILSTGSQYGTAFNANATYEALYNNQNSYIEGSASAGSNGFGQSFLLDQILDLLPGAQVLVIISASAEAGLPGGDPVVSHAVVEPQYLIDPAFAPQYYFDGLPVAQVGPISPGAPNGTVPEPSTGWLMLMGAVVVGRSIRLPRRGVFPRYPFSRLCAGSIAVR